jgi:hypothetical protein
MTTPNAKKGRTVLTSSDPCPRGCQTNGRGAVHLLSDHVEEKARQCNLCSCVIQDTHDQKPG